MKLRHGDRRRRDLLDAALAIWATDPAGVTLRGVARRAGVSHGVVTYHFGSLDGLQADAASLAVSEGHSRVIAQLIATRHPAVRDMDEETRHAHMMRAGF